MKNQFMSISARTIWGTLLVGLCALLIMVGAPRAHAQVAAPTAAGASGVITGESVGATVPGMALVRWQTSVPTTSKVVYGTMSVYTPGLAPLYGYSYASTEITSASTTHSIVLPTLNSQTTYYLRPISTTASGTVIIGSEISIKPVGTLQTTIPTPIAMPSSTGQTTGTSGASGAGTQCTYLTSYLYPGSSNNSSVAVGKLQAFLQGREGDTSVVVTGTFDSATLAAVKAFQAKYATDILAPWGLTQPTGNVAITTTKKINEIFCGVRMPLTQTQIQAMNVIKARAAGKSVASAAGTGGSAGSGMTNSGSVSAGTGTGISGTATSSTTGTTGTMTGTTGMVTGANASGTAGLGTTGSSSGFQSFVASVFAIPHNMQDVYSMLVDLLLILFIIAVLWLLTKEYVFYGDGMPTAYQLSHDRMTFFSVGSLVAAVISAYFGFNSVVLPLFIIFVILLIMRINATGDEDELNIDPARMPAKRPDNTPVVSSSKPASPEGQNKGAVSPSSQPKEQKDASRTQNVNASVNTTTPAQQHSQVSKTVVEIDSKK